MEKTGGHLIENSHKKLSMKIDVKKYAMFIALIVIALFFEITTDGILLAPMNVSKLIMQNSYILILAIGMLPCILVGEIDLSVGSIVAVVSAVAGTLIISNGFSVGAAAIICLIIGTLIGAWHGFWIAIVRVPSFIVTLAGMLLFRGITMIILDGKTLSPFPDSFQFMAQNYLSDIPIIHSLPYSTMIVGILLVLWFVISEVKSRKVAITYNIPIGSHKNFILKLIAGVVIILISAYWLTQFRGLPIVLILLSALVIFYSFITNRTVLGRQFYAVGGNIRASQLSGVKTKLIKFIAFTNMGFLAAIAGLIFAARLNCSAPSAGFMFEMDAIAACIIGGTSMSGGIGTIVGTIVGGLVVGVLNNGMSIMGIGIDWQQGIKGLVLLFAVAFDIYSRNHK